MRNVCTVLFVLALLTVGIAAAPADAAPPASVATNDSVKAFALQWYAQMQAGKLPARNTPPAYGAQLTDEAVRAM